MADFDEQQQAAAPVHDNAGDENQELVEVQEKYDNLTPEQQEEIKEVFEMFDKENN